MPGPAAVPAVGCSTVRVGRGPKDAETVRSPVIVTVQDRLPVQAPPHDRRPDPPSGVAVSGTRWPGCRTAVQVDRQPEIPAAETLPLPDTCTVNIGGLTTVTVREPRAVRPPGEVARTLN